MKKFFIGLMGATVLLIGVAMLVLPGPGMLVIAGGLAILATEFFWARRALRNAKRAVARVRRRSGLRDWLRRAKARSSKMALLGRPWQKHSGSLQFAAMPALALTALPPSRSRLFLALAGWVVLSFAAASLGGLFRPGDWYAALNKPPWNPPGWIFGPVWTALYTMMALAAWLVWKRGGFAQQGRPLTFFLVQLALNAAWSPLFFGLHWTGVAFAEILLLWLAIAATIASFHAVHRAAAWLLAPYLAWVSFAAFLNFTLWRLNS